MAKGGTEQDPFERWRHFEARYADAVGPFLRDDSASALSKEDLVELVALREKADRWRDRFFKQSNRA